MFKFIRKYAETIDHAQIYPLFSLVVFFIFFVVLLLLVKRMNKQQIETLSNIPFNQEDNNNMHL